MDDEERMSAEARSWVAGVLLVAAVAVYAGWCSARSGTSAEPQRRAAQQPAAAPDTARRAP